MNDHLYTLLISVAGSLLVALFLWAISRTPTKDGEKAKRVVSEKGKGWQNAIDKGLVSPINEGGTLSLDGFYERERCAGRPFKKHSGEFINTGLPYVAPSDYTTGTFSNSATFTLGGLDAQQIAQEDKQRGVVGRFTDGNKAYHMKDDGKGWQLDRESDGLRTYGLMFQDLQRAAEPK